MDFTVVNENCNFLGYNLGKLQALQRSPHYIMASELNIFLVCLMFIRNGGFFILLFLKDLFAEYRITVFFYFFPLSILKTLCLCLFTCNVPDKKYTVIFIFILEYLIVFIPFTIFFPLILCNLIIVMIWLDVIFVCVFLVLQIVEILGSLALQF